VIPGSRKDSARTCCCSGSVRWQWERAARGYRDARLRASLQCATVSQNRRSHANDRDTYASLIMYVECWEWSRRRSTEVSKATEQLILTLHEQWMNWTRYLQRHYNSKRQCTPRLHGNKQKCITRLTRYQQHTELTSAQGFWKPLSCYNTTAFKFSLITVFLLEYSLQSLHPAIKRCDREKGMQVLCRKFEPGLRTFFLGF